MNSLSTRRQIIIGFAGRAGAGKTTAAQHLVQHHGFERVRFAGPLKAMMRALGCTEEEVDGARKEMPCDLLGGRTPRLAMQWLGTEWGRDMIAPDLWTRAWEYAAAGKPRVVVDDVRFPNEVEAVRRLGGVVLQLIAPGDLALASSFAGHVSERGGLDVDADLINCRGAGFFATLDHMMRQQRFRASDLAGFVGALGE
ncbi:deoxynucleotide monophosphate kinase [Xanthobacter sp.]|uniref:deoxynucleotide monophosphate kinase n=1 Tax=Xanthobacter sp. TaxID=35809 RepID=UPI0025E2F949|nr:deoxynucleotide monophosphate kinase [Xanthobacter sp.]